MDNQHPQMDIPLGKLIPWADNVRGLSNGKEGAMKMSELVASIRSVGLLQNLVVQKAPAGKWVVIAGGRRLEALGILAREGAIKKNAKIPCSMNAADPVEIGLAENVVRENMHPAAQFDAFKALVATHPVADIAARFGVAESLVVKRLALARVSPKLLALYRADKMTLDQLQAFTVTDDHRLQERVWRELPEFNRTGNYIRRVLSQTRLVATDRRAQFVTVEAYEKAGGLVKRDLFSEGDDEGIFLLDEAKLDRMVEAKLEEMAALLRGEGWSWVEAMPALDIALQSKYTRVHPTPVPLPRKQEARIVKLQKQLDAIYENEGGDDDDGEGSEKVRAQVRKLESEIAEIANSQKYVFPPEVYASGGAIATMSHEGEPKFLRGLILAKDEKKLSRVEEGKEATAKQPSLYSASLIEDLSALKTAAIAAELAGNAKVALAATVHSLLSHEFRLECRGDVADPCVQISTTRPRMVGRTEHSKAGEALNQSRADVLAKLPAEAEEWWGWCLAQSQAELLKLLAFCVSLSVNGIVTKFEGKGRAGHADELAAALKMNVGKWFVPTAENFFGRVSRAVVFDCLRAAGKPPSAETLLLKKADLAAFAEKEVAGTGWLPDPMLLAKREEKPEAAAAETPEPAA